MTDPNDTPTLDLDVLRAALVHALPYCYEAADQTIQCPECDACWWDVPEGIDEDWHAPGCKLFAARVMVGVSQPVRKRSRGEPSEPYAPNEPRPDTRTPSHILRDQIMSGWAYQLARMSDPVTAPEWLQGEAWRRAVHEIMRRLLEATGPLRGPYARVEGAQPSSAVAESERIAALEAERDAALARVRELEAAAQAVADATRAEERERCARLLDSMAREATDEDDMLLVASACAVALRSGREP